MWSLGGRTVFKVMTWNVENLFKPGSPSGPPSQAVYDVKLQGLASTIEAQAPDALSVQEIGDPAALDDLVQRLTGTWHHDTPEVEAPDLSRGAASTAG